jgi:hypothetical protein
MDRAVREMVSVQTIRDAHTPLLCPTPRAMRYTGTYVTNTAPRTYPQADERRVTFGFFGFGLICFHITAILFSVLNLKTASAAVVSIILGVFMLAFYTNTKRIYNRMKIDDGDMQTGQVVIGGYGEIACL